MVGGWDQQIQLNKSKLVSFSWQRAQQPSVLFVISRPGFESIGNGEPRTRARNPFCDVCARGVTICITLLCLSYDHYAPWALLPSEQRSLATLVTVSILCVPQLSRATVWGTYVASRWSRQRRTCPVKRVFHSPRAHTRFTKVPKAPGWWRPLSGI